MTLRQSLDLESREKLAELVRQMPECQVRRLVGGLSPEALARALAGLPVQRGTIALIRSGIANQRPTAR